MIGKKHEDGTATFSREFWYERFKVKVSFRLWKQEGVCLPRFYLPVGRKIETGEIECWVFYLAPFVIFWRIIKGSMWNLWRDLVELCELMNSRIRKK